MIAEQKLWIDHVSWTRNFIVSDLASLPDKDVTLQRLLKNQEHTIKFANMISEGIMKQFP